MHHVSSLSLALHIYVWNSKDQFDSYHVPFLRQTTQNPNIESLARQPLFNTFDISLFKCSFKTHLNTLNVSPPSPGAQIYLDTKIRIENLEISLKRKFEPNYVSARSLGHTNISGHQNRFDESDVSSLYEQHKINYRKLGLSASIRSKCTTSPIMSVESDSKTTPLPSWLFLLSWLFIYIWEFESPNREH